MPSPSFTFVVSHLHHGAGHGLAGMDATHGGLNAGHKIVFVDGFRSLVGGGLGFEHFVFDVVHCSDNLLK